MNILILLGGEVFSGAEITTLRFVQQFPKDWNIKVCSSPTSPGIGTIKNMGFDIIEWKNESSKDDILIRASHFISEPEKTNEFAKCARVALDDILLDFKPNCVITSMFPIAMLALPVLKKYNTPLIVHHQLMYKDIPNHPIIKPIEKVTNYANIIITTSDAVKKPLTKSNIFNTKTIYAGIDYNKYVHYERNPKEGRILALGTWHSIKGLEYLIKAVALLENKNLDFKLEIAGPLDSYSANYADKIIELSQNLVSKNLIEFSGKTENALNNYSKASIFILPSSEPDPLPTVILEAMAMGLPVIATNAGGTIEQVEDGITGFIIPPQNPQAIADKIEILLKNPHLAQEMGRKGSIRAKNLFNIEKQVEKFINII